MRGPIPDRPRNRPTVPHVVPLIEAYYRMPGNSVGGNLHIVIDDDNIDDDDIAWCRARAAELGDAAGVTLADMLLQMTRTQRRRAISRANLYNY